MSSEKEDGELEAVKSVTLTQDSDGSIILHCSPSDEDSEPLQKKLCLSTEQDDAHNFSVVSLPMSEDSGNFDMTMAATSEGELSEDGVAHIQILQEDDSVQRSDISPVSQAWFTTKEDKDTLANKGHKWKQGMWSKEEIDILMSNIDRYVKDRGIESAAEIIFDMSKEERKDFYRSVAWGLNRPLFAVYRRVLRMYDNRNHVGKYKPEEIEKLKTLKEKHGNDWATIGAALGRSASSVKDRCRLMKDTCNTGKWTEEEERRLAEVVYEMAGVTPGSAVTGGVSWAVVAEKVRTRSEKQCRSKWLNYLNWKHSGGTEWTKEDDQNLIQRISELEVEEENDIKWEDLAGGWSSVRSPQWLRSKWWSIKRQVTNHKEIPFSVLLKGLQELTASSQTTSGSGSPSSSSSSSLQIRLTRLEESSNSSTSNSVAALQIPVQIPLQITHLASDSSAATSDSGTITLNTGALQTFEILPSFQLQPTGTPGTYYLQTTSNQGLPLLSTNQGLPLSLTNNSTVTLTSSSPPSHEHIILHSLSTDSLCSNDGVIIHTVTSDPTSLDPASQSQLVVEAEDNTQDHLDTSSLLNTAQSVVTESQEAITDHFDGKEVHQSSVEATVVNSELTSGNTVLIVSPHNISSTLTDPILENQEGSD
ncbi:cyclin-D-binding Myb-like transcription factor 1 [Periophthalmus magnuspinnatus]|uniref:cyclin-D-binding Myb-like transcription factor 1 n=1 Tax=Periophthalmus magnuspinnatus TaxID=409849 RepID=UPI00145B00B7|nr:cyclin-D-binding Myb-like transcription factor 1 [Periophthalmus magnuspinnatus]